MSVIFQLFSAMDLKGFNSHQLKLLRDEVVKALYEPAILAHIKKRADQVYEQLTARQPTQKPISDPCPAPLSIPADERKRCPQMFTEADLEPQVITNEQREILEWAIECELQHSYRVLEDIQTRANYFFSRLKNGNLPQGHDTSYSHIDDPVLRPQTISREYLG
jgi:hypothetical protein